nr:putative pleckstrin (PH) domain, reverse transcriptase, RNA-dependent DNA polymerase [Tanacetum cinerariifolium]
MEAHLALTQPTHVNKVTSSCEICSGPHDTQYCMENPEQAFVDYASLRTNEAGKRMNRTLVERVRCLLLHAGLPASFWDEALNMSPMRINSPTSCVHFEYNKTGRKEENKNIRRIAQLKRDLSKSFAMKDLGPAIHILVIRIFCDRGAKKLHISQDQYIEKVLRRFNMDKAKVVSSPITPNFKLTDKDCPSSKKNIEKRDRGLYASAGGSLMYAMVCTRPDLAHAVGVVSRFLSNPEAEYVATTEACKELLLLKKFLQELGFKQQRYA